MNTRQKIENSGKGQRWEFNKKRLFGETDYISTVCADLNNVATVSFENYYVSVKVGLCQKSTRFRTASNQVEKSLGSEVLIASIYLDYIPF